MTTTATATAGWGRKFRAAREARGVTQLQLSELTGIPQPVISRIERGQRSLDQYLAIARALGLTFEELSEIEPTAA